MKKYLLLLIIPLLACLFSGCDLTTVPTSDQVQNAQQERIAKEAASSLGLPNIHNFFEKRLLKEIYELRDQSKLITYTYLHSEQSGKLIFVGKSIGYGIPYATQYTNPEKIVEYYSNSGGNVTLPQADPNGLFSPASADGTWVLLIDDATGSASPVFFEPRIVVSQFKLPDSVLAK